MNSQGTFVVNGVARVIINQILRSPGIYYNSELDHNGISIYTSTIHFRSRRKITIRNRWKKQEYGLV